MVDWSVAERAEALPLRDYVPALADTIVADLAADCCRPHLDRAVPDDELAFVDLPLVYRGDVLDGEGRVPAEAEQARPEAYNLLGIYAALVDRPLAEVSPQHRHAATVERAIPTIDRR